MNAKSLIPLAYVLACFAQSDAHATAFTNSAAFLNALSGYAIQTLDFESTTASTVIPSGTALNGTSFHYALLGNPHMIVADQYSTTSGNHSLGLDSTDGAFISGDSFTLSFQQPISAIGLYVIGSPGDVLPGDIQLQTAWETVANASMKTVLPDGGEAFFLGLTGNGSQSSYTATLNTFDANTAFSYLKSY